MTSDETIRDEWPLIVRQMSYCLYIPFAEIDQEHVDGAFRGVIDRPGKNTPTRREYLSATRAALASDVDLTALLGFAHPDSVVREFLVAVERRLSEELGE